MTTHPVQPGRTSTDGGHGPLAVRLLLLAVVGGGFSYLAAQILYVGLWAYGIAQQEGAEGVSALLVGGYAAALLVLLVGFVLAGRAMAGSAWWVALPSLVLGPVLLLAQTGLL